MDALVASSLPYATRTTASVRSSRTAGSWREGSALELPEVGREPDLDEELLQGRDGLGVYDRSRRSPYQCWDSVHISATVTLSPDAGWLCFDRRNVIVLQVSTMSSHHWLAGKANDTKPTLLSSRPSLTPR